MDKKFINADTFRHKSIKTRKGEHFVYKRNGKTQLWVTRPGEFRIPVKRGLCEYGNITQDNASEFEAV